MYLENNPSVTELQIIHDCHPLYDLIRYLFFFPDGGEGWHPAQRNINGGKISLSKYYKFLLHERPEQNHRITGNSILQGQKLMMEFVVMAYIREQEQNLRLVRQNQKKLRAETYKSLCEHVEAGNEQGKNHGRRVILPKSFYGSVRWYQQKNYESLAIARTRGKPHLFITTTCNPNHPSVLKVIPCGVSLANRPDMA